MRPTNLLAAFFARILNQTFRNAEARIKAGEPKDTSRRGVRAMQRRAMNEAERASGIPKHSGSTRGATAPTSTPSRPRSRRRPVVSDFTTWLRELWHTFWLAYHRQTQAAARRNHNTRCSWTADREAYHLLKLAEVTR